MLTQNKPARKLELKKKTISQLTQGQSQQNYDGASTTIIVATIGCGSDFTRVTRTIGTISTISVSH